MSNNPHRPSPHLLFAIWDAVNVVIPALVDLPYWLHHLFIAGLAAGTVLWIWYAVSERSAIPKPMIVLPAGYSPAVSRRKHVYPVYVVAALATVGWGWWTFWYDRLEARVRRVAAESHIMQGISGCTPSCINVDIERTEALSQFSDRYDLVVVCRAVTPDTPFWQDPDLFRSKNHPIQDDTITVPAPPEFLARVCTRGDLFQCIPAIVSRSTNELIGINPGLRTDAKCTGGQVIPDRPPAPQQARVNTVDSG